MARIRRLEIENFRGIRELEWFPAPGINCLLGPGDSGKSSILDAIDLALGARRSVQFTDADFHRMNVDAPICISVTLGELDDRLKSLDSYGLYLGSFDPETKAIDDEPKHGTETVITVQLTVASDLEPAWELVSERAAALGQTRGLSWADRERLAPARVGVMGDYHFGWKRGSVLNRISDERADAAAALASAAREARAAFGDASRDQLTDALRIVAETARELGVPVGDNIRAMLDAHSVSFSGGTISLHDDAGVPLSGLGAGSARLLIAGLQRKAAFRSTVVLVDEVEHGLEPQRIVRLLGSLGAKEEQPPLQVFATTHSPVTVRELSGDQLFVVRAGVTRHEVREVGTSDEIQGAVRLFPEALLSRSVLVCEGASEVGLVRGLDLHRVAAGAISISADGVALISTGGGSADGPVNRASVFRALGFRVAVLRDADLQPTPAVDAAFIAAGGCIVTWRPGRTLEEELFMSMSDGAVARLLERAVDLHGDALVNEHIKSSSLNASSLQSVQAELEVIGPTEDMRRILGKAASTKNSSWFKTVTKMENLARDIIGPDLSKADDGFQALIGSTFTWCAGV